MRYFFEIAYLGTNYHGWQIQNNANTVQAEVNKALSMLCSVDINVTGSGRTDTGVHCEQQYFHADFNKEQEVSDLLYKLNSFLPFDISINSIRAVGSKAHTRFDALERKYEYRIVTTKSPFLKGQSYFYNKPLDLPTMNAAASLLVGGEQDFECFSKVKTEVNNFNCTISTAEWQTENNSITFHISANRFLRGMVRAIVGTLLDVGLGKLSVQEFDEIIKSKDRTQAGRSAPAEGLFLTEVNYPEGIFI